MTTAIFRKCLGILAFMVLLGIAPIAPQGSESPSTQQLTSEDMNARLMLALSTSDYPATPGDVYTLAYFATALGGAVTTPLTLDAGYQLKVQNMGTLNGRGKTYLQLRAEVVNLVSRNYPMSGVSLTLTHMGRFNVLVTGEAIRSGNLSVDGLTRLSALATNLTGKASTRFVTVTPASGNAVTYDLFLARR
ncbi:MAG: ligand-binding protein, partial [Treponema sp.]|nr:ligand-binding protein [Treponema sp.]